MISSCGAKMAWPLSETVPVSMPVYSAVATLGFAQTVDWVSVVGAPHAGWALTAVAVANMVLRAATLQLAMRPLVVKYVFHLFAQLFSAREKDPIAASLFRIKSRQMAAAYQAVFSEQARRFGVTVAAGSIYLPSPSVREGRVQAGRGPVYNACAVFGPDGQVHPHLARKAFPIGSELPFVAPEPVDRLQVYETPAGRLGVMICADAWYPQVYQHFKAQKVDFLAVPSLAANPGGWRKPWGGYNGAPTPADVKKSDVGRLSEAQAWRKYALAGRIGQAGARLGVNVFLHGELWDLGASEGQSLAVREGKVVEASQQGAALMNVWL